MRRQSKAPRQMDCEKQESAQHIQVRKCGYEFCGQLRVKQKYEGIIVSRKSIPLPKIEKPRRAENADIADMRLTNQGKRCGTADV